MNKILFSSFVVSLLFSLNANALDTTGYIKISALKAFGSSLSVYLEDNQTHNCAGSPSKLFVSDTAKTHHTSFLLTAFTAGRGVNLKYSCVNNAATIVGVRLNQDF